MDLVKLTNTGKDAVEFRGNELTVIKPGTSKIVTWEFACQWLGRPDIDDPVERKTAFDLVRLAWGYMDGVHTDDTWVNGGGVVPDTGAAMHTLPSIKVETLGDGSDGSAQEIVMLIADPDRTAVTPGFGDAPLPADTADVTLLKAHLEKQAAEMESLKAMIAGLVSNPNPELDPQSSTALSTVDSDAAVKESAGKSTAELPKPKATAKGAADGPLHVK